MKVRIQGLSAEGFRVLGLGFRVLGSGFRVWGLGRIAHAMGRRRVEGLGFREPA